MNACQHEWVTGESYLRLECARCGLSPDARLIAAAPELLAALEDIAAAYTWTANQLRERAVDAIARARGANDNEKEK